MDHDGTLDHILQNINFVNDRLKELYETVDALTLSASPGETLPHPRGDESAALLGPDHSPQAPTEMPGPLGAGDRAPAPPLHEGTPVEEGPSLAERVGHLEDMFLFLIEGDDHGDSVKQMIENKIRDVLAVPTIPLASRDLHAQRHAEQDCVPRHAVITPWALSLWRTVRSVENHTDAFM